MTEPQPFYIISPLSQCGNPEKQEKFLSYIRKIAPVTAASEPDCEAYAWFRSAEDNDAVPKHWLRGFEVYKHPEASTVTHRASDEYKAFRAAVGNEGLLERPSDLRPWYSTGVGFLRREGEQGSGADEAYVIVNELKPHKGKKPEIIRNLKEISEMALLDETKIFSSFIVLDRGNQIDQETAEQDEGLYVLSRTKTKKDLNKYVQNESRKRIWEEIQGLCDWSRETTWIGDGVGFIGRQ